MKINDKWLGYCTNVHAGHNLEVTRRNLTNFALPVKEDCCPSEPMGIGLWLSDQTAIELISQNQISEFGDWLQDKGLIPFTFNGFPYGNFHQNEVKKRVYLPTWADDSRREYSERLAQIQNELLPQGMEGSISTLPLAWDDDLVDSEFLSSCADQLIELAEFLENLENNSGRLIYFCLEPEPGCVMQTSQSCIDFFMQHLLGRSRGTDELVKRYLRICHDICHSAVMFEDQAEFVTNILDAGIQIGKVQVSSAVHAEFEPKAEDTNREILAQLSQFHEPRYLHQTVLKSVEGELEFFEDLPFALKELSPNPERYQEARIHFHVPIYLKEFRHLKTSQTEIYRCLDATQNLTHLTHYEAETYAWDVLPAELQQANLSTGIAAEIKWLADLE